MYFSNYEPEAISLLFMRLLAKCTVLVVENGNCDSSERLRTRLLNELSAGKLTPAQLEQLGDPESMFRGFEQILGKAVYKTKKRVVLENSPWGDEEGRRFLTFLNLRQEQLRLTKLL